MWYREDVGSPIYSIGKTQILIHVRNILVPCTLVP